MISWQVWALGAAGFAALTAMFAKLGVAEMPPDMATLRRTGVIFILVAAIVFGSGQWVSPRALSARGALLLAVRV